MIVAAFAFLVLLTGVPAIFRGEFMLGLSGTIAPFLAMIGGGGISANLRERDHPLIRTALTGIAMLGLALFWIYYSGWHVQFGKIDIPGFAWILIAFVIGLLFDRNANK